MARDGDERLEAKLDRLDDVEATCLRHAERLDLLNRKIDLTRSEVKARIETLRVDLLEDMQAVLKVELGGRQALTDAELERLRAEVEELGRTVAALERR